MLRTILLSLAILGFAPVANANNDIYEIKNVSVAVQETDALKAREKAFNDAQIKAFDLLQKKLVDNGYVTAGQKPTPAQIQNSVKSIDVVSEKITSKEYRASYNILFNEKSISRIFNIAKIEPPKVAQKFLVVPIVLEPNGVKIWKNDWRKTWEAQKHDAVVFPLGDLQDIQNLKNEDIAANKYDGIFRMQKRYGATSVVLVQAEYIQNTTSLMVQLENIKDNDRTVINYEYPGGNGITEKDLFDAAAADLSFRLQNDKLTDESVVANATPEPAQLAPLPGTAAPHAAAPAAPAHAQAPAPVTKTPEPYSPMAPGAGILGAKPPAPAQPSTLQNIPPAAGEATTAATPTQFDAVVTAPDLIAWNRIRNKIVVTQGVDDLQIKSFTSGQAFVTIKHSADVETIRQTLATKGIALIGSGNNWEIKEQ